MSFQHLLEDSRLVRILTHPEESEDAWRSELERFLDGDTRLTRRSADEGAVSAVQRMMVLLGYSTASKGGFLIDGDFGRGTNRGIAQFQFDHNLGSVTRTQLCYPCQWSNAASRITNIPEVRLTPTVLEAMANEVIRLCDENMLMCGNLDDALFHLDALHRRQYLDCPGIMERYGDMAASACQDVAEETGRSVNPLWVLAIIRQETAGVIRPRFEQHWLSKQNSKEPSKSLETLRMECMSQGLGQVMGFNYKLVGAESPQQLFTSSVFEQVKFVVRFLARGQFFPSVGKSTATEDDYRRVAKSYNGSGYAKHHYHEKLERWFNAFRQLS